MVVEKALAQILRNQETMMRTMAPSTELTDRIRETRAMLGPRPCEKCGAAAVWVWKPGVLKPPGFTAPGPRCDAHKYKEDDGPVLTSFFQEQPEKTMTREVPCEMIVNAGSEDNFDKECGKPSIGNCQDVPVCKEHAAEMVTEGFEVNTWPAAPSE